MERIIVGHLALRARMPLPALFLVFQNREMMTNIMVQKCSPQTPRPMSSAFLGVHSHVQQTSQTHYVQNETPDLQPKDDTDPAFFIQQMAAPSFQPFRFKNTLESFLTPLIFTPFI